jgi:hypothetical protein
MGRLMHRYTQHYRAHRRFIDHRLLFHPPNEK